MAYMTDEERRNKIKMNQRPKPATLGDSQINGSMPSMDTLGGRTVNAPAQAGVPVIRAPQMEDWRKSAAGPRVGMGDVRTAERQPVQPTSETTPRPAEMAVAGAAMGATGEAEKPALTREQKLEAIRQNQLRNRTQDQGNLRRMQFLDSQRDHGGLTPEQKAAALNERRGLAMDRIGLDEQQQLNRAATTPSMQIQSPEQVRSGQANLNQQGVSIAQANIKRLQEEAKAPGANMEAIQEQLRQEFQKMAAFSQRADTAMSTGGPGYDESVAAANKAVAGQGRIREGQDMARADSMGLAMEGIGQQDTERESRIRMAEVRRRAQESGLEAESAQNDRSTRMAKELPIQGGAERLEEIQANTIADAVNNDPTAKQRMIDSYMRSNGLAKTHPGTLTRNVTMAKRLVETIRSEAQGDLLEIGDEGAVFGSNIDKLNSTAELLEATLAYLEGAAADAPDEVGLAAMEILNSAPTWLSESKVKPGLLLFRSPMYKKRTNSVVARLNAIAPRLNALATVGP